MKNALEVLTEMDRWWHMPMPLDSVPRTPANAVQYGITWLYNQTYSDFSKMTEPSSRVSHFRSLFTVWKAVCSRMTSYPFYDPTLDAPRAFPLYVERMLPHMFVLLLGRNVFLGVVFTQEEKDRHFQLQRTYVQRPEAVDRLTQRAGNQMLSRSAQVSHGRR